MPRYRNIGAVVADIVELLANDKPLPPRYRDHALVGNWIGLRECHVRSDLLLIYDKPEPGVLILSRLGTHSELFG